MKSMRVLVGIKTSNSPAFGGTPKIIFSILIVISLNFKMNTDWIFSHFNISYVHAKDGVGQVYRS